MEMQKIKTDVLVIGGGGAGVRAALTALEKGVTVTLVCKELIARSGSTPLGSWGYAASFGHNDPADSPRQHFLDTLREGRYLSDQDLAEILAQKAPESALDLERYGLKIKKLADGRFEQIRVPGETYPRSLLIEGGGRRIVRVLWQELRKWSKQLRLLEDTFIGSLLRQENTVTGAWGYDFREGCPVFVDAGAVIIATGGHGALWGLSDNPPGNIGDGFFLAYHAGAALVDLEQMLYYPMVLISPPDARGTLIDYEVCLEPTFCDGKLLNSLGEEFIATDPLPARDELMQVIVREVREGRGSPSGGVFLDLSRSAKSQAEVAHYAQTMLTAYPYLRELGVDLISQPVEIASATHYALGGIRIDRACRTDVEGLFAAGEVAGNIHGANRISGNALAETQVFGKIAGESAAEYVRQKKAKAGSGTIPESTLLALSCPLTNLACTVGNSSGAVPNAPVALKKRIRRIMDQDVGYGRSEESLQRALAELRQIKEEGLPRLPAQSGGVFNIALLDVLESQVMLDVAQLVCLAALARKETRGHHLRIDYPSASEGEVRHTVITQKEGRAVVRLEAVRRASGLFEKKERRYKHRNECF